MSIIKINALHHVAIICSDYKKSKKFYTEVLGFKVISELYRKERGSFKLDLSLHGKYLIELFSFQGSPQRLTQPESTGLRHIAFEVDDVDKCMEILKQNKFFVEEVRIDEITSKKFTFLFDPDDLPIEIYEKI